MGSQSMTTVPLSDVDTDHLAKQALKLFAKRYSRQYDLFKDGAPEDDPIPFADWPKVFVKVYGMTEAQAMQKSLLNWELLTGGCTPTEVPSVTRQQCIDLCVKGYHSKDPKRIERLKKVVEQFATSHFDNIDANHDGYISSEEYYTYVAKYGKKSDLKGVFESMDLNGDGVISKEEFLKVNEGFHFYCDEDRYNHRVGIIEDNY